MANFLGKTADMTLNNKAQSDAVTKVVKANTKLIDSARQFVEAMTRMLESDPTALCNNILKMGFSGLFLWFMYNLCVRLLNRFDKKEGEENENA